MINITVKSLAADIQTSVDRLVQQFADAGIQKAADDTVTIQEKLTLLAYLNKENGSSSNKLLLQRKMRSTLNIPGAGGKSKSVQIEIRKTRTIIKCDHHQDLSSESIANENQTDCKTELKVKKENIDKTGFLDIRSVSDINSAEKNRINNQKIEKRIKPDHWIKKLCYEETVTGKKYKTEKEIHFIEKECKKEYKKENIIESYEHQNEHSGDHHTVTNNQYNYQVDYNDDYKLENSRRSRGAKAARLQKKGNKHIELRIDNEENKSVTRNFKILKRIKNKSYALQHSFKKPIQNINRDVVIGETITVSELANKMAVKGSQVVKEMIKMGAMVTINQVIDQETAQLVAEEMGHKVILRRENELEEAVMSDRDMGFTVESRAPVVTVMGHVDHGKTSLLDYIRSAKVASGEAGGITQHIGAYHVETNNGMITFLDTPGHAAFTSMRARGIKITDIVVLVVAADDGVMPQTIEAIQHAKAADVPIIVAINKIDKPEADLDRVKNELSQHGILPEDWGGETQFAYISAKMGIGIDKLLEIILLQAEILELKAIRKGMASGTVTESFLDKGRGPIATVLVREGTLCKGDIVLCGLEYGRIRAMLNELGQEVLEAGPSIPVEILGLSGVPAAGDEVTVVRDEKKAREVALYRQGKFREVKLACQKKHKLENIFSTVNDGEVRKINIVLKADARGSVEAICDSLLKLSTDEVKLKIIGSGVGGINETDASLAAASNAILIGFNVRADASARNLAEVENLDLRYYSVIYNLIDEVKAIMGGILSPKIKQQIIGLAEVRNVFKSPKFGAIAGCMVVEGAIKRQNPIRILRNNIVIYEGELESLRRFKDDVNEVRNGIECGIGVKNYNNVCIGDIIEVFKIVEIQRSTFIK